MTGSDYVIKAVHNTGLQTVGKPGVSTAAYCRLTKESFESFNRSRIYPDLGTNVLKAM